MAIPMPKQENIRKMDAMGISSRKIAEKCGVSRNTVAKYVNKSDYSLKPAAVNPKSIVDNYSNVLEEWLLEDLLMPRKQRHTAKRIFDRLVAQHSYDGSYSTVSRWVKRWKMGRATAGDGFSELEWGPGFAQADFGVADAIIQGTQTIVHLLVVTFPFSNTRYAVALPGENAECVCEGLKTIFEHVGAAPHTIVFDNATGVGRRGSGGVVTETKVFQAFRMHYRFEARFTNPYAGNEKGSVENAVGFIRRNLLVPVPHAESLQGLTAALLADCDELLSREHYRKKQALRVLFGGDKEAMLPLPGISFDACSWDVRKVDLVGNIVVNETKYYVGSEHAGTRVNVGFRAFQIEILDVTHTKIVEHKRVYGRQDKTVRFQSQLLPSLVRKPSSIRNSPVREHLPEPLLNYLDSSGHERRRKTFEVLTKATATCGFEMATQIVSEVLADGREIVASEIEMVARVHAEGREVDGDVDLRVYDKFLEAK